MIRNYNILVKKLRNAGFKIEKLNEKGICAGISAYYFKCAEKNMRSELFACFKFIILLNNEQGMTELIKQYQKRGKNFLVAATAEEQPIPFEWVLNFLQGIAIAQQNHTFATIGANWDCTKTYFCQGQEELLACLKQARIENGTYMAISLGNHQFSIERISGDSRGFYIIEPNNMCLELNSTKPKLFKTIDEVAKEFYNNYDLAEEGDYIALSICFISYGDTNCELDDAIHIWEITRDNHDLNPALEKLIARYWQGYQSRIDLVIALLAKIEEQGNNIPKALQILQEKLKAYSDKHKVTTDLQYIDHIMTVHPEYIKHTASNHYTFWLYLAAFNNQIELVKKLLVKNADPNQVVADGTTALFIAAQEGYLEVVEVLLKNNANPNQARTDGVTALYVAACQGHLEVVEVLLKNNADPNQAIENGATPIFIAAQGGQLNMVKVLLARGAEPNLVTKKFKTPLSRAEHNGHKEIAKVLRCAIAFNQALQLLKQVSSVNSFFSPCPNSELVEAYKYQQQYFLDYLYLVLENKNNTLTAGQLKKLCSTDFIIQLSETFAPNLKTLFNEINSEVIIGDALGTKLQK